MNGGKDMGVSLRISLSKRFLLILSIVFLLPFSLFPLFMTETSMGGHIWSIEPVDTTGRYVGYDSSIKIDSLGRPHISYIGEDPTGDALKYAHWNGVRWEIEVVDSSITVWSGTSLALDSLDRPHITYHDDDSKDLRYAHWDGSGWEIEVVDSLGKVGYDSSLDMDSHGNPHITYGVSKNDTGRIRYAYWNGTSWNFHDLDYSNEVGESHLVLDSTDIPHISFLDFSEGNVMYAKWNGSDWLVELVDDEGSSGDQNSLALDSSDRPHIAYHVTYLPGDDEVRYASWDGTNWIIETAWVGGRNAYEWLSLDLDSQGRPGIAYERPNNRDLLYIWKSEGKWHDETVYPGPEDVSTPSLTFDQMDFPHISYSYDGESDLFHATVVPPPLPDLTLYDWDIGFDPSSPVLNGTSVNITATIRNIGGADALGVKARFYDGPPPSGVQINGDQNLGTIPSMSTSTASIQWTAGPPGTHEICVFADPNNTIVEYNETNNMACRLIEVISPSGPGPPIIVDATLSGFNLENVTFRWNLSIDDGAGLNNVVRYDIYRSGAYDQDKGYRHYDSVPNGTSYYIDVGAGEGNQSNYFYYVCAVNIASNSSCSPNQAGKFTRPLGAGPNLISIPFIQSNESIEKVLQTVEYDRAWYYDSSSQEWKWHMKSKTYRRGLWSVNHTMGLWVNVTQDSTLTIAGLVPTETVIHLYAGWNLVGFPSFNSTYSVLRLKSEVGAIRVEGCDPSLPPHYLRVLSDIEVLRAGEAYWMKVDVDVDWIVEES